MKINIRILNMNCESSICVIVTDHLYGLQLLVFLFFPLYRSTPADGSTAARALVLMQRFVLFWDFISIKNIFLTSNDNKTTLTIAP